MNWGYKILTVYVVFIVGILFLVFKSSSQNQDLVTRDYYEQELKYQQRIDEIKRTNDLSAVKYEISKQAITVSFPEEMKEKKLTGHVLLYCTADKNKDIEKDFSTENGQLQIALPAGNKGLHELKIDWMAAGTSYYYEHKIMIP